MIQYQAIKEQHYQKETGAYTAWGIMGFHSPQGIRINYSVYISDVFLNEKEASDFAKQCTVLALSLIHLPDVIEDYLGS